MTYLIGILYAVTVPVLIVRKLRLLEGSAYIKLCYDRFRHGDTVIFPYFQTHDNTGSHKERKHYTQHQQCYLLFALSSVHALNKIIRIRKICFHKY